MERTVQTINELEGLARNNDGYILSGMYVGDYY